jgi:hypothetical protein
VATVLEAGSLIASAAAVMRSLRRSLGQS